MLQASQTGMIRFYRNFGRDIAPQHAGLSVGPLISSWGGKQNIGSVNLMIETEWCLSKNE